MHAIRIEGLQKRFGKVQALDGLTLSVKEGVVFGFLGPNGAGKTTTIRILSGLAHADGGQAWVADQPVGVAQGLLARRIGYLPEDPTFYNWMSPAEFLDYVGALFGLTRPKRAARCRELLQLVGLAEHSKRRIAGFSRGMRQRLGIAQALLNRAPVLFLDEPASALDPVGRKEVLDLIAGLREQCTVFMSTHILADVERVCDSVGIISRGRLVAEADQAELLSRYAAPVFELEAESEYARPVQAWAGSLRSLAWVRGVTVDGVVARVTVADVERAKRELLPAAIQAGLILKRYEMVRPSLEDVFLRLVGQGEVRA